MSDLFQAARPQTYDASAIEVLEGLEPVRRRPGMYVGGTDERALHHLVAEVLDNAMDEAIAGHADRIELEVLAADRVAVRDNGRGIPIDEHPRFPGRSALEIILTTLHAGAKFSEKAYTTSGGLNGVGVSVVNALSSELVVEVARDRQLWRQSYARGVPLGPVAPAGAAPNRRGTLVTFRPDPEIFGAGVRFRPETLWRLARSKAYLHRGITLRWRCAEGLLDPRSGVPPEAELRFPGGLPEYLAHAVEGQETVTPLPFTGEVAFTGVPGRVEWAIHWLGFGDGFTSSYVNTIPTPEGGTHEAGLRAALTRALRAHGERIGNKKAEKLTPEDAAGSAAVMLSVFLREPQFAGQTKDRLTTTEAQRLVENAVKDAADHHFAADPAAAKLLLDHAIERAEERIRRKEEREQARKTPTRRLRLPGKLVDCSRTGRAGTEIFLVEGDSAGGSAKQARDRETQALLPLRGKILNVASASPDKMRANAELTDLAQALGCGAGRDFDLERLRYERVIIMTDADVDGAHIASLLVTYFFRMMRPLVDRGHLYLAQPPLYRLIQGARSVYAMTDADRDRKLASEFRAGSKVEIRRFKGLGEMPASDLKETTMDPARRTLLRVTVPNPAEAGAAEAAGEIADLVERLMGRNPEPRFRFITENARFVREIDV